MAQPQPRRPTGPFIYLSVLVGFGLAMAAVKPFWERAGHDSVRSECQVNLELIADGQAAWIQQNGRPLACAAHPPELPDGGTAWDDLPLCWTQLGFDGGYILHGQYVVEATATSWTARCTVRLGQETEVWEASNETTAHRVEG